MQRRTLLKQTAAATTALGFAGMATAARRESDRQTEAGVTVENFRYTGPAGTDAESESTVSVDGSTVTVEGTVAPDGRELNGATPSVSETDGGVRFALSYESRETETSGRRRNRSRHSPTYTYEATLSVSETPDAVDVEYVDEAVDFARYRSRETVDGTPDWVFEVLGRDAEADHGADIGIDGSNVSVDGTVVGYSSCYSAAPSAVTSEDRVLEIDIATERAADENQVCAQQLIGIDYEMEVDLDARPHDVVLSHDGDWQTTYPQVRAADE